ncbi:MAG TPA: DUF58 domain-containing protein [bacterium]|nr:DUF58 domain-containing protein [bacterium]
MKAKALPAEILAKVKRLKIVAGRRVDESLAGQFRSVFRGSGIEFDEIREYGPGDDVRSIDWNVTARVGKPFVKRYVEERERRLVLVVDLSGSQRFGTQVTLKAELAAEVAALLAAAALRTNDKVGLVAFTDSIERFVPARKGERHAIRVIRDVLGYEPRSSGTNLSGTLDEVCRTVRRGAILVVISDFVADGFEESLRRASRLHDLIAVRVNDRREEELPPVGLVRMVDLESGREIEIDASDSRTREAWAERAAARRATLETQMRRAGADYVEVRTGEDYVEPLRRLFARRRMRKLKPQAKSPGAPGGKKR